MSDENFEIEDIEEDDETDEDEDCTPDCCDQMAAMIEYTNSREDFGRCKHGCRNDNHCPECQHEKSPSHQRHLSDDF